MISCIACDSVPGRSTMVFVYCTFELIMNVEDCGHTCTNSMEACCGFLMLFYYICLPLKMFCGLKHFTHPSIGIVVSR